MSIFNRMKIGTKLPLAFLLFGVLPAIVYTTLFEIAKEDLKGSYGEKIMVTAESTGDVIDRNLFERYGDVQAFGLNAAIAETRNWYSAEESNPIVQAINSYVKLYGLYPLSLAVDMEGRPIALNTRNLKGEPIDSAPLMQKNFKDTSWFKAVQKGEFLNGTNGFTGTVVEQPLRIEDVSKATGVDNTFIVFAAPIFESGKQIGVWANFADFGLVKDIVSAARKNLVDQGLVSAEVAVIGADGTVLHEETGAASAVHEKNDENLLKDGDEAVMAMFKNKSGYVFTVDIHDPNGPKEIAGYALTNGAYDYSGLGWGVVIRASEKEALAQLLDVEQQFFVGGGILLLFTIAFGTFIARSFSKPLIRATAGLQALANQDLNVVITDTDRGDEIGDIARAQQVFKENLEQMERMKIEQKAAEIKSAEEKRKAMNDLASGFEGSVGQIVTLVSSAATELNASAENLSAIADETSRQTTTVAAATEEASVSVQTVASSAEELTASIAEINRQVAESSRVTAEAVAEAKRTDTTVASLSQAASQIGEVVQLIQEIAEQTNLLALNATIEAARAGEAGKGFAVVASEVKNLASQTAKATEEISKQVGMIQNVSNDAVTAIRQIGTTIDKVSSITAQISSAMEQQSAATKEIAHSVQQAAAGTAEVSSTITSVTQAADESRGASGQVLDAARELATQADSLRREVTSFVETVRKA